MLSVKKVCMRPSLLKSVLLAAERHGLRAGWASQILRVVTRAADVTAYQAAQHTPTRAAQFSERTRGNYAPSKQVILIVYVQKTACSQTTS